MGKKNWKRVSILGIPEPERSSPVESAPATPRTPRQAWAATSALPILEGPRPEHGGSGALCSRCASIDFDAIFKRPTDLTQPILVLGNLPSRPQTSSCTLCRLLESVKSHHVHPGEASEDDEWGLFHVKGYPLPFEKASALVIAKVTEDDKSRSLTAVDEYIGLSSNAHPLLHPNVCRVEHVNANTVDFATVRQWLSECKKNHIFEHDSDSYSPPSAPMKFKLIDCHKRRVVVSEVEKTYCALSYVWGPGQHHKDTWTGPKGELINIPPTIEDAIKVVGELGLRYLWIDRYCISQVEGAEKDAQVKQMDVIYRNAYLTIIAAAGSDPRHGLPGVSTRARSQQLDAHVGKWHFVSSLQYPEVTIKASSWITRAWTFQEAFFSRRRLIFTDEQVYYDCRDGRKWETLEQSTWLRTSSTLGRYSQGDCQRVEELISMFCPKRLSREDDAIRAFEGIFNSLRTEDPDACTYYGLSFSAPHSNDRRLLSDALLLALCWRSRTPGGSRRERFPSWTWAGWQLDQCEWWRWRGLGARVAYRSADQEDDDDDLFLERDGDALLPRFPQIFIEKADRSLASFHESFDTFKGSLEPPSRFIHIKTWTIELAIEPDSLWKTGGVVAASTGVGPDVGSYGPTKTGGGGYVAVFTYPTSPHDRFAFPLTTVQGVPDIQASYPASAQPKPVLAGSPPAATTAAAASSDYLGIVVGSPSLDCHEYFVIAVRARDDPHSGRYYERLGELDMRRNVDFLRRRGGEGEGGGEGGAKIAAGGVQRVVWGTHGYKMCKKMMFWGSKWDMVRVG